MAISIGVSFLQNDFFFLTSFLSEVGSFSYSTPAWNSSSEPFESLTPDFLNMASAENEVFFLSCFPFMGRVCSRVSIAPTRSWPSIRSADPDACEDARGFGTEGRLGESNAGDGKFRSIEDWNTAEDAAGVLVDSRTALFGGSGRGLWGGSPIHLDGGSGRGR